MRRQLKIEQETYKSIQEKLKIDELKVSIELQKAKLKALKCGSSATTFIDPDIDGGQIIFGGKIHEKHRRKSMVIPYRLILKIAILALIIFHNIDFIFAILIL